MESKKFLKIDPVRFMRKLFLIKIFGKQTVELVLVKMTLFGNMFSVIYCPKLPVPSHGTLSTYETVYDTLVVVACDVGFKHADDRTSKTVLCLESTTWNDTDVHCQGLWQKAKQRRFIHNVY